MNTKPEEYLAISMWCKLLEGSREYTQEQQALAAADRAPIDAIFKHKDEWVCVSDLDEDHLVRIRYEARLASGDLKPDVWYLKATLTVTEYYTLPADVTDEDYIDIYGNSEAVYSEQEIDSFEVVDELPD